jgi:uncharacterized protein YutE (UPF0331/DUF86 family)
MAPLDNTYQTVVSKLELMQSYFERLDPLLLPPDQAILANTTVLSAIERNFQLIVDAAIDINTAIIKKENFQTPDDYQGTFEILARCSALPSELAFAMAPSVGLRNALVHVYEKIDPARVIHDIKHNMDQYRQYMKHILEYIESKKVSKLP